MAIARLIKRFIKDEFAVTAIEYALIAAIVSLSIVVILGTMETGLNTRSRSVNTGLTK